MHTPTAPTFDVREAFGRFPTGVVVIAADTGSGPAGMLVSSFSVGVSLDPPLVSFAPQRTSETWPTLRACRALGVSVLARDQRDLCAKLSSKADRTGRFDGVPHHVHPSGALVLGGATTTMEVEFEGEFPAGDHTVALLRVTSVRSDDACQPLLFYRSKFEAIAIN